MDKDTVELPGEDWVSHAEGGGCWLDGDTVVQVMFRDGMISEPARASLWWFSKDRGRSQWIHRGRANDIVAYRVCSAPPRKDIAE